MSVTQESSIVHPGEEGRMYKKPHIRKKGIEKLSLGSISNIRSIAIESRLKKFVVTTVTRFLRFSSRK